MIVENELVEMQQKALEKPKYKRKTVQTEPIKDNDLSPLFDMAISGINRKAKYTNDEMGLKAFTDLSIEYLLKLSEANEKASENDNMRLVPDIESWATFLGISRATIYNYEKNYNEDWKEFIDRFKNAITGFKKSLAFAGKFNPVLLIFDLTNNSKYYNSSMFTIKSETQTDDTVYKLPTERQEKLMLDDLKEQEKEKSYLSESKQEEDLEPLPFL